MGFKTCDFCNCQEHTDKIFECNFCKREICEDCCLHFDNGRIDVCKVCHYHELKNDRNSESDSE